MKTAVNPVSMFMALKVWVASLTTSRKLTDIATNTSPVRAAEPVPTTMKKLFHWSGLYSSEPITGAMLTEGNFVQRPGYRGPRKQGGALARGPSRGAL